MTTATVDRFPLGYAIASVVLTVIAIVGASAADLSPLSGNVAGLLWVFVAYRLWRGENSAHRYALVLALLSVFGSAVALVIGLVAGWQAGTLALVGLSIAWGGVGVWLFVQR